MNQTNIYQKLQLIQTKFKLGIKKEKENKFQKYKYFDENSILEQLKPHLETEKLLLIFSDDITSFSKEKIEKE
jgi:ERF superfamily